MNFSGKNVLVTGSSRGIGAEIAKVLAILIFIFSVSTFITN